MSAPVKVGTFRGYVVRHVDGGHLRHTGGETEWTHAGKPHMFRTATSAEARAEKTREWDGTRGTACDRFMVTPAYDGPGEARFVEVEEEPKPAPVVAAEGLFACLVEAEGGRRFFREFKGRDLVEAGARAEAEAIVGAPGTIGTSAVVRVFKDGEHEAALAAARREERERVTLDYEARVDNLRGALEEIRDSFESGHTDLSPHMSAALSYALGEEEEAAKGQAK